MPFFNELLGPRYAILIYERAMCTAFYRENDPIRAREIFEYAVVECEQSKANRRVELYDSPYLIEAWSSEDE